MARYTLNLSEICEQLTGLNFNDLSGLPFDRIDDIAVSAIPKLFSDRIDVLDNGGDMQDLYRRIIEHYWEYEVCTYTPSDFILRLNRKLNDIMPYYNQRYESTKLEFPVFEDVNYSTHDDDQYENNDTYKQDTNETHTGTDTTNYGKWGDDHISDRESGTSTLTNEHGDVYEYGKTLSSANDNDYVDADVTAKSYDWQYNNDTPQGGVSITVEPPNGSNSNDGGSHIGNTVSADYLTSYGLTTHEKQNRRILNTPGARTDMNGNAYNHDHHYDEATGGTFGSDMTQYSEKQGGNDNTHGNWQNIQTHGRGNDRWITYGHHTQSALEHGHEINGTNNHTDNLHHGGEANHKAWGKMNQNRTYSEMLNQYRSTMINIYDEIIEELHELFFLIY